MKENVTLEIELSEEEYNLMQVAASLGNVSVKEFILGEAIEMAEDLLDASGEMEED